MKAYIANYLISMVENPDDQDYLQQRLAGEVEEESEYKSAEKSLKGAALFALAFIFIDRPLFTLVGTIALIYTVASLISKLFI